MDTQAPQPKSTFAGEVNQAITNIRSGKPANEQASTYVGHEMLNNGLNPAAAGPANAELELPVGGKEPPPPEKAPAKFRIAGHEFETQEEALAYAEKTLLDKVQDDAYTQGRKDALTPAQQVEIKSVMDEVEELLFVDPKAALTKLDALVKGTVKSALDSEKKAMQQEAANKAALDKAYGDFYKKNTDLANMTEFMELATQKLWEEVKDLPIEKALARIGTEARGYIKKVREASSPTKELSNDPAIVATGSGSSPAPATLGSTAKSPIAFIDQINKHRKRA